MAVVKTKDLFDAYFVDKAESTIKKTRPQIDRKEVYAKEIELGKQLVDMDEQELFDMIIGFKNRKAVTSDEVMISGASFRKYVSAFRSLFDFYINNYEVIKNPFRSARFKGIQADTEFAAKKRRFTKDVMMDAIQKVRSYYEQDRADYLELLIRLFYEGFSDAKEIIELKEEMIDFEKKEISLPGRTIKLSDRCFELLLINHNSEVIENVRGQFLLLPWHGGYFKVINRPKEADNFQSYTAVEAGRKINRVIVMKIAKQFDIDINYRKLYLLGFYEYGVEKYGEERMKELVTFCNDHEAHTTFVALARSYPIQLENMIELKRSLTIFI